MQCVLMIHQNILDFFLIAQIFYFVIWCLLGCIDLNWSIKSNILKQIDEQLNLMPLQWSHL